MIKYGNARHVHVLFVAYVYVCSTHHTPGLEQSNEGPPLERVSFSLSHQIVMGDRVTVLCAVAGSIMVPADDSIILRISWEGVANKAMAIDLKSLEFTNEQSSGDCHNLCNVCFSGTAFVLFHAGFFTRYSVCP